jgi:ubiquinone/menaquinone biosynthesis C-methylase UbiE
VARVNYRECHLRDDDAQAYHDVYAAGYYAAQWRQLEQPWLAALFEELRAGGSRTMLDMACGQGRISLLGAKHFDRVLGIDFSSQMLVRAEQAADADPTLANADLRFEVGDVGSFSAEAPYDVVTAFRFFLNAEDELRIDGLRCARRNLSPSGTFIASVQCSGTSPLAWFYSASGTARRLSGKPISSVRNALSLSALKKMLAAEGFQVYRVHRYSLLPRIGRLTESLAEKHLARIERLGKIVPGLSLLSQAYIVCARPC